MNSGQNARYKPLEIVNDVGEVPVVSRMHSNFYPCSLCREDGPSKFCLSSLFFTQARWVKNSSLPIVPSIYLSLFKWTMMNVAQDADAVATKLPIMIKDNREEPTKLELTITSLKAKNKHSTENAGNEVEKSCYQIVPVDAAETQRYIPKNKKPDAALTFPEKVRLTNCRRLSTGGIDRICHLPTLPISSSLQLATSSSLFFFRQLMSLMKFAAKAGDPENYCVAWLPDGKSFIIRNPDDFTRKVLPKFFKATKFSSFTRKCMFS
jgi:hypothetical protein